MTKLDSAFTIEVEKCPRRDLEALREKWEAIREHSYSSGFGIVTVNSVLKLIDNRLKNEPDTDTIKIYKVAIANYEKKLVIYKEKLSKIKKLLKKNVLDTKETLVKKRITLIYKYEEKIKNIKQAIRNLKSLINIQYNREIV